MTGRIVIGVIYEQVKNVRFHVFAKTRRKSFYEGKNAASSIYLQEIAGFHNACLKDGAFPIIVFKKYNGTFNYRLELKKRLILFFQKKFDFTINEN